MKMMNLKINQEEKDYTRVMTAEAQEVLAAKFHQNHSNLKNCLLKIKKMLKLVKFPKV